MNNLRKLTQEYLLKSVSISKTTKSILEDLFKAMSDKDFDLFMRRLKDKKINLSFVIPLTEKITEEEIIKHAVSLGIKLEQRVTFFDGDFEYTSPVTYFMINAPIKRANQTQDKKESMSTGNKIDTLTGQVTGESLSAKLTMPESLIHLGYGVKYPLMELHNARGGDQGLQHAMNESIMKTGSVSLENIKSESTGNVGLKTLKAYFLASHLKMT